MITVTLGTIQFPFARSIHWIRRLLEQGTIAEQVFVQYGFSDISLIAEHPLVTTESIMPPERLNQHIQSSRLVISHAGQGSTRKLASMGVSFVILPRLARLGEHIDDHQLSFAYSVGDLGVTYCTTLEELEEAVVKPPRPIGKPLLKEPRLAEHLIRFYHRDRRIRSVESHRQS